MDYDRWRDMQKSDEVWNNASKDEQSEWFEVLADAWAVAARRSPGLAGQVAIEAEKEARDAAARLRR